MWKYWSCIILYNIIWFYQWFFIILLSVQIYHILVHVIFNFIIAYKKFINNDFLPRRIIHRIIFATSSSGVKKGWKKGVKKGWKKGVEEGDGRRGCKKGVEEGVEEEGERRGGRRGGRRGWKKGLEEGGERRGWMKGVEEGGISGCDQEWSLKEISFICHFSSEYQEENAMH